MAHEEEGEWHMRRGVAHEEEGEWHMRRGMLHMGQPDGHCAMKTDMGPE